MIQDICNWLTANSTGIIFTLLLCLCLGYAIGKVKLGIISLGATVGTLLMGVVISALVGNYAQYSIPGEFRSIFFCLFIFALGYDVGPAFVKNLKSSGLKLILMAMIFTVVALGVGVGCYYVFGLGKGELVGLFAGCTTQSSILGSAQSMMTSLGIEGEVAKEMNTNMTAAYALGYLISYAGCVLFIKLVMPYVVGCKGAPGLRDAVKKSVEKNGFTETGKGSLFNGIRLRTYRLDEGELIGVTIGELEKKLGERVMVESLIRPDKGGAPACVDFTDQTALAKGDVVALLGDIDQIAPLASEGITEVTDQAYQKVTIVKKKIVVTKDIAEDELGALFGDHILPAEATRNGKRLTDLRSFKHGDVLTLIGTQKALQKITKAVGYTVDSGENSNIIYMSAGMLVGLLVGILSITIAGVPIGLGTSGGLILLGILCGWYNDKNPSRGYISPGARSLMKNIGLNLFVACLGLSSGASFVSSVVSMGVPMIISIVLMSLIPHVLTVLIAKFLLKLDPVDLLGGTCGSGTNTAALNALVDETGSSIFAASYTPAYAMANITLTFLGVISIALFH